MKVIVKKKILDEALRVLVEETDDDRASIISDEGEEEPITPRPQMGTQLSVEMPPVESPDYVPANPPELSLAASVIANEVPQDQIDFFYRRLHKLLDDAIDRESDSEYVEEPTVAEEAAEADEVEITDVSEAFRKAVSRILAEQDGDFDLDDDDAEDVDLSDEDEDRLLSTASSSQDPIRDVTDEIEMIRSKVSTDKRNAIFSADTLKLDMIDREYGWMFYSKEEEKMALPWLVLKSLKLPSVKKKFEKAVQELGIPESEATKQVIQTYRSELPETGLPLSDDPDLAAEMHSNVLIASMTDPADDLPAFEKEVAEKAEEVSAQGSIVASFADKTGSPPIKVTIPSDKFIAALSQAKDRKIASLEPATSFEEEDVDIEKMKKQYKQLKMVKYFRLIKYWCH